MFQLTEQEFDHLKSQIVISSWGGLRRAYPYAFTEQGVAMLSSVLRSKRAICEKEDLTHVRNNANMATE
jgi:hypothetical protein